VRGDEVIGEAIDQGGARVVVLARVWHEKVLRDHAELDGYLPDVLRAISRGGRASICALQARVDGCWWS
jgi:hypothetical protein